MLIDSSENYIFEFLLRWLRFEVRLYFSKIMAVRYGCKRPKKQLQLPLVLQKTPVTVVILPENTHFLCFFFKRSALVVEKFQPKFRPMIALDRSIDVFQIFSCRWLAVTTDFSVSFSIILPSDFSYQCSQ